MNKILLRIALSFSLGAPLAVHGQYNILVSGPTDICGSNTTQLSVTPSGGTSFRWFQYAAYPMGMPYTTGSVFSSPPTGYWICEVTSSTGTFVTSPVLIRTSFPSVVNSFGNLVTSATDCSPSGVFLTEQISAMYSMPVYSSYQWKKNGIPISGANNWSYSATTSGTYTLETGLACGTGVSNSVTVTIVNPIPSPLSLSASGPLTFCTGGSVVLSVTTTGASYQWRLNGSNISGATGSSYTASLSGNYTCIVSNACNTVNSNTVTVTVNPAPSAIITTSGPTSFCNGGSVTLNASAGAGYAYQWNRNGTILPGATFTSYTATTTGNYDVIVTNTGTGCSKTSAATTVTVLPLPTATASAGGPTTFCAGSGVTLSANTGTGLTYQWYKYSNPIAGATQQTYFAGTSGSFKVQVTDVNGCSRKSNAILVTSIPLPPASVTASGPTSFCAGDSVVLTANSGTGLTYQWKRYSAIINGATLQSYTVKNAGKYKVLVTNSSGCSRASNSITVTVPCREGQESAFGNNLEFFYDAAHRTFVFKGYESGKLEIMSADGRIVLASDLNGNEDVDLKSLSAGIYFAVFRSAESEPVLTKFYHSGEY